jgi:hypothetical protein
VLRHFILLSVLLTPSSLLAQINADHHSIDRARMIERQENFSHVALAGIVFFVCLAMILFVLARRTRKPKIRDPQIFEAKPKKAKTMAKKSISGDAASSGSNFNPPTKTRQPLVITGETQEMITTLVTSIKVPESSKKPPPTKEEIQKQTDDLENSEVMHALAGTLVSAPRTDETPSGRFSKMSIEGDLIFEEEIEQKKAEAGKKS